ncbi:MAG: FtsX-like permease family protein [Lachnospiraceae bacterium]|nr:FtsX-like permease family protein [Lachnospiraceae bacterium]
MFFDILKKDLKRRKTMNIIIFLFVILAVMFISSSVNNVNAVTSSLDTYFSMADVGDFVTVERGNTSKSAAEFAEGLEFVKNVKEEPIIFNTAGIRFKGKNVTVSDFIMLCSIDQRIQNFYDADNKKIEAVPEGNVYIRKSFLDSAGLSVGDKITVPVEDTEIELTIKGELKDAAFGAMMMGTPRFLMNQKDYDKFLREKKIEGYKGAVTFIDTEKISDLEQTLNECQNILFMGPKSTLQFTYIMEMVVAGVLMIVSIFLIIIALIVLRFTITFTLSEEFREIGVMKAIGIPNRNIRGLYLVKYFAISVIGAVIGFLISIPFGNLLLKQTGETIILSHSGFLFFGIASAVLVIFIILLFCYRSTRQIKTFTPVDAIRNGTTGERYRKKGVLKLYHSSLKPVPFMACNDILSSIKRFAIMLITFSIGILLISVIANTTNTLQSGKLVSLFAIAESDLFLSDAGKQGVYMTENGRTTYEADLEKIKDTLAENGMEADVFGEVTYKFTVKKGKLSANSLTFQGINTHTDMYEYMDGSAPENTDEIALNYLVAEKIGAAIGDTVTLSTPEGDSDFILVATFQSMTNMGDGIRLHEDLRYDFKYINGLWGCQIKFADHPSEAEIINRKEKLEKLLSDYEIRTAGEYVDYMVGGVSDYIRDTKLLVIVVVLLINLLVAVLMEKSFLTKERGEIAMLKAVGFKNGSILAWQMLRIAIIMLLATLIAVLLSNPVSQLSSGAVFRMMGAYSIKFDMSILEGFLLYPLLMLLATVFGVFLTALSVRGIRANEINSVE